MKIVIVKEDLSDLQKMLGDLNDRLIKDGFETPGALRGVRNEVSAILKVVYRMVEGTEQVANSNENQETPALSPGVLVDSFCNLIREESPANQVELFARVVKSLSVGRDNRKVGLECELESIKSRDEELAKCGESIKEISNSFRI